MTNAYPNLPVLPYKKTSADMNDVIQYIKASPYIAEVKRSCYTIFRIESANGQSGVNNNYIGLQADGNKSDDKVSEHIIGTCIKNENMTGKERIFACFNSWKDSIDILEYQVVNRGLFIGGIAHPYSNMKVTSPLDLALAYAREWVYGDGKIIPDKDAVDMFVSIYKQATLKFI
jgi:hypothetical protein